jgi:hypothetical protein
MSGGQRRECWAYGGAGSACRFSSWEQAGSGLLWCLALSYRGRRCGKGGLGDAGQTGTIGDGGCAGWLIWLTCPPAGWRKQRRRAGLSMAIRFSTAVHRAAGDQRHAATALP